MADELNEVATLIDRWNEGDTRSRDLFLARALDDLRKTAAIILRRWGRGTRVEVDDLVNEVALQLLRPSRQWGNWRQFHAVLHQLIRQTLMYLVAKEKKHSKGIRGRRVKIDLAQIEDSSLNRSIIDFITINDAIESLATTEPRLAQLLIYRFFFGHTLSDICADLELSRSNGHRLMAHAVTHLARLLEPPQTVGSGLPSVEATADSRRKVEIELTLERDYAEFTAENQVELLARLQELLKAKEKLAIVRARSGSVKLTIEVTQAQAEQLIWLARNGKLRDLNVSDAHVLGAESASAMVRHKIGEGRFDVFMCHNSMDKSYIKRIGTRLRQFGLLPWIDEWELRPGLPWQRCLEQQITNIRSAAVFVGNSGLGPWQNMELEAFLRQFVGRECPVIPAVLRGCKIPPKLPPFLNGMTWVNFNKPSPDPYERLVWGITGKKP
jgi:RNA polymerase sigma factor (sigma-70 family)